MDSMQLLAHINIYNCLTYRCLTFTQAGYQAIKHDNTCIYRGVRVNLQRPLLSNPSA